MNARFYYSFSSLFFIFFLLLGTVCYSQQRVVLGGFEYNDIYYKTNVKGLKMFINEVEMPDDLKQSLTGQMNEIKKANTVAYAGLIGGSIIGIAAVSAAGGGNSGLSLAGLAIMGAGYAIFFIAKPNEQDYYDFINTFNKHQNQSKIQMGFNLFSNPQQDVGFNLAVTF